MTIISFTQFRKHLRNIIQRLEDDQTPITVTLKGGSPFVMMSKTEFESWQETHYLLQSPENAKRLREARQDLQNGFQNFNERSLIDTDE